MNQHGSDLRRVTFASPLPPISSSLTPALVREMQDSYTLLAGGVHAHPLNVADLQTSL
jgi:hypothetical protein